MHTLRKKIAAQKAQIMKNLEMGTDKIELDRQIEDLQSLQKDYIKMEMAIDQIRDRTDVCLSDGDNSLSITDSEESRLPQSSAYRNREMLESSYAPSLTRSLPSIGPYRNNLFFLSLEILINLFPLQKILNTLFVFQVSLFVALVRKHILNTKFESRYQMRNGFYCEDTVDSENYT